MKLKIKYKDFVNVYPKMWNSSLFYPILLRLKNKGFDFQKIKKILGDKVPTSTVYFWFNKKRVPLPFKEFLKIKKEFNAKDLEGLAVIIGHVIGDGGINQKKVLHYCNTEEFLIDEFQSTMENVFTTKPMARYKEDSGIIRLQYPRLFSRILLCLFGKFANGKNKKITSQIEKMPLWGKVKLLQALYDDDGSVPESGYCIALKQKDKNIILWAQKVLKEIDINSRLTPDGDKWHLRITNYLDLVKFRDKVNFSKGYRKQIQLNKTIEQIKFPHWKTKNKIIDLLKEGAKTRNELTKGFDIELGTVYGHLHGWKRTIGKSNPGLIDLRFVRVKKVGRRNLYYLSIQECLQPSECGQNLSSTAQTASGGCG